MTNTGSIPEPKKGIWLSVREQYIVAQALHVAIETMGKVEPAVMREESNIADMKRLRETVFDFPEIAFEKVSGIVTKDRSFSR